MWKNRRAVFFLESGFQKYQPDKKRRGWLATVLMHFIKMHFVKIYDPWFFYSLYLKWPGMFMLSDWFKNDFFDIVQLVCGPWLGLFGILVRLTTVLHDDSVRFDSINSGRIPKYSSIGPFFRSLFPNSKSENKNISQIIRQRTDAQKPNEKQFFHSKLLFCFIEIWHRPIRSVAMRGRATWLRMTHLRILFLLTVKIVGDKPIFLWQWK